METATTPISSNRPSEHDGSEPGSSGLALPPDEQEQLTLIYGGHTHVFNGVQRGKVRHFPFAYAARGVGGCAQTSQSDQRRKGLAPSWYKDHLAHGVAVCPHQPAPFPQVEFLLHVCSDTSADAEFSEAAGLTPAEFRRVSPWGVSSDCQTLMTVVDGLYTAAPSAGYASSIPKDTPLHVSEGLCGAAGVVAAFQGEEGAGAPQAAARGVLGC